MKRRQPTTSGKLAGASTEDIKKDFSNDQLAGIGAAAMAWNEVEYLLDVMLYSALALPSLHWLDLVTRINGIDGKLELLRQCVAKDRRIAADAAAVMKQSLDDAGLYKTYRDAVIHARMFNAPAGIGQRIERQAKISQVILTKDALEGFYDRLVLLRRELQGILAVFDILRTFRVNRPVPVLIDPRTTQFSPTAQAWMIRVQEHQKQRLSLPPLPEFPD
jgi:hypothetical protein